MTKRCVVVGGGLPGIVASLTLAKQGHSVHLLEAASALGGLLRSYEADGLEFDYGTHFANKTGIAALDALLFSGYEAEWREFPVLRAGNFCNGRLNESSDNPDLSTFGRETHDRCLAELLAAAGWQSPPSPETSRDFLVAEYGSTLVDSFFDPVFQKFTGVNTEVLHHQAHILFNLKRFAVLDPAATAELKKSPRYDSKISFHHRDHFHGHKPCFYPATGGIGRWIEQLAEKLRLTNVNVITESNIQAVRLGQGRVDSLVTGSGVIEVDELFWCIAPAVFGKLAGLHLDSHKPPLRSTVLVGLAADRPFLSDCHYITVFDPAYRSFRITLYDTFRGDPTAAHAASVEFMMDPLEVDSVDWTMVAETELRSMGLMAADASVRSRHTQTVANGFPVQTATAVRCLEKHSAAVRAFTNVHLLGRGSGEGWFLTDLVRQAYHCVNGVP